MLLDYREARIGKTLLNIFLKRLEQATGFHYITMRA